MVETSSPEEQGAPADAQQNCIFCHIIAGRVPSKEVYSDSKVKAILDINPANPGHVLILPKEHYMILPQVPEELIGYMGMVSKAISKACIRALKVQGTNVFVANGAAAGQKAAPASGANGGPGGLLAPTSGAPGLESVLGALGVGR